MADADGWASFDHFEGFLGVCRVAVVICASCVLLSPRYATRAVVCLPALTGACCGWAYAPSTLAAARAAPFGAMLVGDIELTAMGRVGAALGAAFLAHTSAQMARGYAVWLAITYAAYAGAGPAAGRGGGRMMNLLFACIAGVLSCLARPVVRWLWARAAPVVLPLTGAALLASAALPGRLVCPAAAVAAPPVGLDCGPDPASAAPALAAFAALLCAGLYRHSGGGAAADPGAPGAAPPRRGCSVAPPSAYRGRSLHPALSDEQAEMRRLLRVAWQHGMEQGRALEQ